jgi:hypothetical protein
MIGGGIMSFRYLLISVLFLCGLASPVFAESFYCPTTDRLLDVGDTTADVLAKCGPPTMTNEVWGRRGRVSYVRWVYDFGNEYFVRFVLIKHDHVFRIDDGAYGTAH